MSTSTSRIIINAHAERVWDTITNPEWVKQWQYGSRLITDWQIGSEIRFRTEWEGNIYEQWGTVLEFAPYQSLRYSLFAPRPGLEDTPENYFTMSYDLSTEGVGTLLKIQQIDNRPGSNSNDEENNVTEDDEQSVLLVLKRLAESTN
ncbi:SRPBCC domain-containing protein [Paenibacillus sp. PR3]|uniref:SRPBCC domain-containing protein n=1 Tax=Paenibacillus terricola TaxID=2763503 RepID=A0ABR8MRI0_9BACL|nr:SRPBCC domain-containing protein [Paenibacillus terricola]MBD3918593.1 SRPBCC domain-containing protein [Paenibacillus terricola]